MWDKEQSVCDLWAKRSVANAAAAAEAPLHLCWVFPHSFSLFVAAVVKPDRGGERERRSEGAEEGEVDNSSAACSMQWKRVSVVMKHYIYTNR